MTGERTPRRFYRQAPALIGVFAFGVGCGLLWDRLPRDEPAGLAHTIHAGRNGLTNPLLECEIPEYRPGREIRPFRPGLEELLRRLEREGRAAHISVYFRDLDNGPWIGVDEDRTFTPGSLLKLPLVMAAMKQAEREPAFLRRPVLFSGFPDDQLLAGYTTADPLVVGKTYVLEDLMSRTASASDNYAAALLGQHIDRGVLRRLLFDLGLPAELADHPEMRAHVSPRTYGQLFRVLYNATYLSHEASERTLEYFARSTFSDGLEAGVPPGTTVAHKFGTFALEDNLAEPALLHDCGIVYSPNRPYFLCVMTHGRDHAALSGVIAEISRFVYEEIERQATHPVAEEERLPGTP